MNVFNQTCFQASVVEPGFSAFKFDTTVLKGLAKTETNLAINNNSSLRFYL